MKEYIILPTYNNKNLFDRGTKQEDGEGLSIEAPSNNLDKDKENIDGNKTITPHTTRNS